LGRVTGAERVLVFLERESRSIPRRAYLLVFVVALASIESTVKYPRIDSLVTTVN
jgi:hypothetical protein